MTGGTPFERLTAEGSGVDVGLLLAPVMADDVDETCAGLLTTSTPDRTNVLFVTTRPPDRCLARLRAHADAEPNEVAIVTLGPAASGAGPVEDPLVTAFASVDDPTNMTRIGVEVTRILEAWADDDVEITACFDSATALLQYADQRVVFRFLGELVDRFRRTETWAHVHLDPGAHDDSTVNSLLQLFDVVVDRSAGEPRAVESTGSDALEELPGDRHQP